MLGEQGGRGDKVLGSSQKSGAFGPVGLGLFFVGVPVTWKQNGAGDHL